MTMSAEDRRRVEGETGFVLHAFPFRETSTIVEVITRSFGRLPLVARGARRPRSALRGVLMEFQPLLLSWFGKPEMPTLARAEWVGGQPLLGGRSLIAGYYLNELLLRLLPREDPHPGLFDAYGEALREMAASPLRPGPLRRFEGTLLRELGYGPTLDREADTGAPVDPERTYAYLVERGPVAADRMTDPSLTVSGRVLLAMAQDDYSEAETLKQGKLLMRTLINHHLGGQALNSRRVFMELQEL
jgi:DNA repair protein RecO (recombination protein O)